MDLNYTKEQTAFREEMAVHGKFGKPCPVCATRIQRIRYADNETDYCPRCQTEGRLLADRALSRLLKDDWPRSIDARAQRPAKGARRGTGERLSPHRGTEEHGLARLVTERRVSPPGMAWSC